MMASNEYEIDFSQRDPIEGVDQLFYQRWSPRAYQSKPVSDEKLQQIFDAARWSQSCFNEQPWLFITSKPKSQSTFVNLLVEGNQNWAKQAPVIGFVVARKNFLRNGNENAHAAFDAGSAWMALTLQARMLGLYTHGMAGIQYEEVYIQFQLDTEEYQVICGFTLGYLDKPDTLPEEMRSKEQPSPRKALAEIWRQE
nr:putative nitroreductase [uncultured bacterium]